MSHNYVREWREFEHLTELPCLEDLVFIGNPLEEESSSNGKYNDEITKRLLYLKKLDGYPVIRNVEVAEEEEVKIQVLASTNLCNQLLIGRVCSKILKWRKMENHRVVDLPEY